MTKRFMMVLLAFLTIGMQVFAQNSVAGKVTDESGEPLVGASVLVKGTHTGAVTDLDGNYKLTGVSSNSVLVFSSIGYKTVEATVGNQKNIYVVLPEDTEYLDDVVVVGYGTARRKDVSGAIASLNYADKQEVATLPNPNALSALSSRIAGFSYAPTSTAGGDNTSTMTIRGMNTIPSGGSKSSSDAAVNKPLLVIDGVLSFGSINEINTSDIESIDVLKDASAAAIYGSRAANGVIIITTKTGRSEKPVVRFNASVSLSDWSRLPKFVTDEDTFFRNRYYSAAASDASLKGKDWATYDKASLMTEIELAAYNDGIYTNWIDEISRTGVGQKYDLSISGRTQSASYYVSGDYTRQQGIRIGDDYEKYTFLGKMDYTINNWLKVGVKGNYLGSNSWGVPARIQNATWMTPYSYKYVRTEGYEDWYNSKPDGSTISPLWGTGSGDSYLWTSAASHSNNVNGVAYAQIDFPFLKGLSLRVTGQGQVNSSRSDNFSRAEIWVDTNNTAQIDDPIAVGGTNSGGSSSASTSQYWNIDNILTYGTDFGRNHIDAMVGYTREHYNGNTLSTSFTGYEAASPFGYYNSESAATQKAGRTRTVTATASYLARINYNYANKYYLTGNFRRDGYSAFAPGHKWGNFYGASAAWVISNEDFMKNQDVFDFLKLRVSYGQNGNRSIGAYATAATMVATASNNGTRTYAWLGNKSAYGMKISKLANQELTWATVTKADLGLDFSVLNGRINGSIDGYMGQTTDMLVARSAAYFTGFSSMNANAGKVTNNGIELSINTVNINGNGRDKFRWESNLVIDHNSNKLVDLYDGKDSDVASYLVTPEGNYALIKGKSINAVYDLKKLGIFQSQDEIDNYKNSKGEVIMKDAVPGDVKFEDLDDNGKIDDNDRQVLGTMDPLFTLNFGNTLSWKNFTLYFNWRWAQGDKTHFLGLDPNAFGTSMRSGNQLARITPWCDDTYYQNLTNEFPRYGYNNDTYKYQWWNSRSFLKLKDLSLAYNVPETAVQKIGLEALRVYVAATDLLTISNWSGLDPETGGTIAAGAASSRYGSNGTYKTVTFGVNVTFGGKLASQKEVNNAGAALAAALAAADAAKAAAAKAEDENAALKKALNDANNALKACEAQPKTMAQKRAEAICVEDIYFELNHSEIRDCESAKVDELIKALKANPDASIEIYGYADQATGTAQRNLMLTKERALAVAEALKAAGIASSRISTEFYGTEKDSSFTPENNRLAVCIVK